MSDLHREKTQMSTLEYSRRLEKTPPERWGSPAIGQGRTPHLGPTCHRAGAGAPPVRGGHLGALNI